MKNYLLNLAVGVDQLANALIGGSADETLSARAFALLEMAENAKHQLPEALEEPVGAHVSSPVRRYTINAAP